MRFDLPVPGPCLALLNKVVSSEDAIVNGTDRDVIGIAPISQAEAGLICFSNLSLEGTLEAHAVPEGAILIVKKSEGESGFTDKFLVISCQKPRRFFIRAVRELFGDPERKAEPKISHLADIDPTAVIEPGVDISPFVSVGAKAKIKAGAVLQSGTFVGPRVEIGKNVLIRPNTVIGIPGQAVERDETGAQILLPHLGSVEIGDNVIIGAGTVIMSGSLENTIIGDNCMIGNQVNIGHNCKIDRDCFIAPQTVVCGSVRMGSRCWIAPGARILNKLTIGSGAMVGLGAVVTKPVAIGNYMFGVPAKPIRKINKYNK